MTEPIIPPKEAYSPDVLVKTFHPDWETIDKSLWIKRILLIIWTLAAYSIYIYIGYHLPGAAMPNLFEDPIRVVEFSLWFFSTMWYVELYLIARHKTKTTQIKWELSHNEEMRVSIIFNQAFGRLFICLYLFYLLRMAFTFIFGFQLPNANIWKVSQGFSTPIQTAYADVVVILGFASYSIFIYAFELTVEGRKRPIFWVIPLAGVILMIFGPYDYVLFTITFTSQLVEPVLLYDFSLIVGWFGGVIIPLLYEIMARRFEYSLPETAKDCRKKGLGFVLLGIAAITSFNQELTLAYMGGLPFDLEVLFRVLLGGLVTFVGIFLIRSAYRPHG